MSMSGIQRGSGCLEDVNPDNAGTPSGTQLFLKRFFFSQFPWAVYWALYFGPWTWLFRGLSWLVPKQANLVIFGSNEGKHFSDNSRSLFEYIQVNDKPIRAVWFTNNKEVYRQIEEKYPGKVVMSPSLRASILYLRAEQAVISFGYQDLCKMPWIPSIKVNQLWHGVPLKKIGLLKTSQRTSEDYGPTWRIFMKWIDKIDRFFVASEYELKIYREAFGIPENRFIISGNPRNDKLHSHKKVNKNNNYGRTILYAPTFRVGKGGAHDQESIHMHPEIDERRMHEFLVENDAKLIIRPHWVSTTSEPTSDRIVRITHDDEPDLNELMIKSDVLVTDYSSAYIDWLILNRPVIFTPYDLIAYTKDYGLLDDYEELVPPPICHTPSDIFSALAEALENPSIYADHREKMKQLYLGDIAGGACGRVYEHISQDM